MGSTLDRNERIEEALRLLRIMDLSKLKSSERLIATTIYNSMIKSDNLSDKELFTLRDIKDKLLDRD